MQKCKENSRPLRWFLLARELPPNDFCSRGCMQREVPPSTMIFAGGDACKENSCPLWWFLISACQRTPTLYNDFCLPGHHTTYNNQPIHLSSLPFFSLFRDNPSFCQPFAPSTIDHGSFAPSLMSNTMLIATMQQGFLHLCGCQLQGQWQMKSWPCWWPQHPQMKAHQKWAHWNLLTKALLPHLPRRHAPPPYPPP